MLYSEGGIHSAQAWMLLKAQGYKSVYMLKGGLDEWKDQVVFPGRRRQPDARRARARRASAKSISAYFGGQPRSAAAVAAGPAVMPGLAAAAAPALPRVVAPPSPGGGAKPPAKKKKEGC